MAQVTEVEVSELETKTLTIQDEASALTVRSDPDLDAANMFVKNIKALQKEVKDTFDPIVSKAHEAHKMATTARKKHLDPLEAIERTVKGKMALYIEAKEAAARKKQAQLDELARREREKEQEKADKKIAALMDKAGDIGAQIDALHKELTASSPDSVEYDRISRQIEALSRKRDAAEQKAAEVQETAEQAYTMPAPVVDAKPQVSGMSTRKKTEVISIDIKALAAEVATGRVPPGVLKADESAIIKLVDAGLTIAGVQTVSRTVIATRT